MAVAAGAAWYREIQIHEDLGHVCRVCGMIVREGLTQSLIISGERHQGQEHISLKSVQRILMRLSLVNVRIAEELNALDIVIHPRHEKQMRPHQLAEILEVDAANRASSLTDVTVDSLVRSINVADGVKARFFTNILSLVESAVEKQSGRRTGLGSKRKCWLVAADSLENTYETAFKKVIPKLWFESSEQCCTSEDFQLNEVDINNSGDELLDNRTMC
ncbi:hypothetical protein VPH35_098971 [Triticum aestivum]|uniref:Uncharacterized protein n=1 Tax=Aegilops tauschii TaxID=37682 RepID=M8C2S1_AEGTA